VRRHHAVEAGYGRRTRDIGAGVTSGDGFRGCGPRLPEGERDHGERQFDGCENRRCARDLRAEVDRATIALLSCPGRGKARDRLYRRAHYTYDYWSSNGTD